MASRRAVTTDPKLRPAVQALAQRIMEEGGSPQHAWIIAEATVEIWRVRQPSRSHPERPKWADIRDSDEELAKIRQRAAPILERRLHFNVGRIARSLADALASAGDDILCGVGGDRRRSRSSARRSRSCRNSAGSTVMNAGPCRDGNAPSATWMPCEGPPQRSPQPVPCRRLARVGRSWLGCDRNGRTGCWRSWQNEPTEAAARRRAFDFGRTKPRRTPAVISAERSQ